MNNNILVIGATGTIGRSLIESLQAANANFCALARTQEKANPLQDEGIPTRIGSLGDWESMKSAISNIDTIFLLTSPSPEQVELQNGLIDLAQEQGISKIVKISVVGATPGDSIHLSDWHGQTEDHLKRSGLNYVILQPHSFMQNTLMSAGTIKDQNAIYQSIGNTKVPLVDTRDVAQACAACLLTDQFDNQTFEITGGIPVGYKEMADAISTATGRNINYVSIPPEAHNQALKEAGLPDWLADDLTGMSASWSQQSIHQPSPDFEKITGNKQYTVNDFARDYAEVFK